MTRDDAVGPLRAPNKHAHSSSSWRAAVVAGTQGTAVHVWYVRIAGLFPMHLDCAVDISYFVAL